MRTPLLFLSSALVLAGFSGAALPQDDANPNALPIASVTCADIAKLPAAYQAGLIYYAAGYRDGLDYARATLVVPSANASSSIPLEISAPSSSSAEAASGSGGSSASSAEGGDTGSGQVVGGLTLQPQEIVTACAGAPHAYLTDIIADHGGARGLQNVTPAPQTIIAASSAPAGATGATGTTPPANAAAPTGITDNSGAAAVSSDLGAASQQFQQNLTAPAGTVPGTGTTPGAGTPGPTTNLQIPGATGGTTGGAAAPGATSP